MNRSSTQSGFTLVEMLVSIALFMVVAVIAVAALLKVVDADKKSQTLQTAVNNVNFAMDSITRELRVGSDYNWNSGEYDGGGVTSPGSSQDNACAGATSGIDYNCADVDSESIMFLSSNVDPTDASNPPHRLTYAYYFAHHPDGIPGHWTLEKAQQSHYGDQLGSASAPYVAILDPSIVITGFTVNVDTDSGVQPSIFLYISGYTGSTAGTETDFNIQTTISERN